MKIIMQIIFHDNIKSVKKCLIPNFHENPGIQDYLILLKIDNMEHPTDKRTIDHIREIIKDWKFPGLLSYTTSYRYEESNWNLKAGSVIRRYHR